MKKLVLFSLCAIALSSCAVTKSSPSSCTVGVDIQAYKAATLVVDEHKLQYTYTPKKRERRGLSETQLVQNAIYEALKDNGYDTLVGVNYSLKLKSRKKVTKVFISGFPAKYKDFRDPTDIDRLNGEAFRNGIIVTIPTE